MSSASANSPIEALSGRGATWYRLTIGRMMLLVAYAAVACFCVTPFVGQVGTRPGDWLAVLAFGAVSIPLAWCILTLLIVRGGRERLVMALLALSCLNGLIVATTILGFALIHEAQRVVALDPYLLKDLGLVGLFLLLFAASLVFLSPWLIPGKCPSCGRRGRLRDAYSKATDPRSGLTIGRRWRCFRCGERFWRIGRAWLTLSDPPPSAPAANLTAPRAGISVEP
jgi:hypothetical protein